MVQLVLCGLLALVLAGALFAIATRFLPAGEQIAPVLRDEPPWDLPESRRLAAEDVEEVRLPVALRGYRFAEADLLLDRLADELRVRDEEIARLRAQRAAGDGFRPPVSPSAPYAGSYYRPRPSTGQRPVSYAAPEIEPDDRR
ncbi:DivIVA domain-containing protein [uncultured Jatrophihabitans sp.]|uniref:DivIVA domain-containing protein n=1 Tax=uncultured Jatrophihabitans sp. TaxID=1610747 RepID=UPI0035CAC00E